MFRRCRIALLVPVVLALSSCADKAPLTTLDPKGPESRSIDKLVDPVFLIAGVVFFAVQLGVLFLAWKYRKRKDDDGSLPPQVHGNFKLEIGWTILPALLLAGVGGASVLTLLDLADEPAEAQEITVIGQQWWWEYRYDVDGDGKDDIVTANDLVIPAGEPIALTITSRDVIHSFWIPALAGKRDAVPGRDHPLVIEADEPGVYRGPVHRVLRAVPRLHAHARRRPLRRGLRGLGGEPAAGRQGAHQRPREAGHGHLPHHVHRLSPRPR